MAALQVVLALALALSAVITIADARNVTTRTVCQPVKTCVSRLERGQPCPLLPVPKTALQDPLPAAGFAVERVRPGVFVYNDGAYFSTILFKNRHLVLVDFPESQDSIGRDGEYLLITAVNNILRGATPRRIDMVYSHRHLDHIGRAGFVKQYLGVTFPGKKIGIWATSETLRFIRRAKKPRVPEPNVTVPKSGRTLVVAPGLKLQLRVVGGHTLMDLACLVPRSWSEKGFLHFIDFFSTGSVPFLDFGATIDFGRYLAAQKEVLKLDWGVINPGHGKLGRRSDLARNIRYTESVLRFAASAGSEVDPARVAEIDQLVADRNAREFGNRGWAFQAAFQLLIDICERKVIRQWGCVLASVDVYAASHCKEALAFTIVDNQD